MAYKKSRGRLVADLFGRSRVFNYDSTAAQEITLDTTRAAVDADVSNTYLTSTFTSNTTFQSAVTNIGQKLGATASVTLTGDVTGSGSFSSNAVSIALTDTNLANTNAYIATKLADITGESIKDLSDVYSSMTPTDGQVLTYDTTNGWQAEDPTGGSGSSATTFVEYTYTATASQQSFSGADDFGQSLDYTADDISVYLNGILLVANTDYQAANTTSIWLINPATADDTLQVQAFNATSIVNVTADVIANSATTSATTAHTIDSFPATTWRSAKYIVQMTSGSDYHATEALVLHDGTSAYVTEYGTIYTNASLGTVDADINTGNVRLLVTPTNATTEVKVVRTGVAV